MESRLFDRVRAIIDGARASAARSVNTAQVVSNWLIGREIVEESQRGRARAGYGEMLIAALARQMRADYGAGYSARNLALMTRFYRIYPDLPGPERILHAPRAKSWKPGRLHPNLSWTHYRTLLTADGPSQRAFYEIEAVKNGWSARELERQMASLLYERLAKSRDKAGVMRLAAKGQVVQAPADVFKDPVVMEFLGCRSRSA